MNYARNREIDDTEDVRIRTKGGPSVPLPSIMPSVARVTRDSAPEQETSQNQFDYIDTDSPQPDVARGALETGENQDANQASSSVSIPSSITGLPTSQGNESESNWNVKDNWNRALPSFYPLEETNCLVKNTAPSIVSGRISDCCRLLSVQADFDDVAGTASLKTGEHVEIHLSLWSGADEEPECVVVEAQRRTGDPIKFHEYTRYLLNAAQGKFDTDNISAARSLIVDKKHSATKSKGDKSLSAVEIAAKLLKKDRLDARRLGMESLCFLTDPSRTGVDTALVASRAVLFGSAENDSEDDVEFQADELGIREAILSLIQYGRLSESSECAIESESDEESTKVNDEDKNFNDVLHNLALAVLSNALEVLEKYGADDAPCSEAQLSQATNDFLKETEEISQRELIDSLLKVLGQAESKPHDACLSAQCLRPLLQASKKARRKARDMNAKQIVATALEVGTRTHVKLQTESMSVLQALEKPDDEVEENNEENN